MRGTCAGAQRDGLESLVELFLAAFWDGNTASMCVRAGRLTFGRSAKQGCLGLLSFSPPLPPLLAASCFALAGRFSCLLICFCCFTHLASTLVLADSANGRETGRFHPPAWSFSRFRRRGYTNGLLFFFSPPVLEGRETESRKVVVSLPNQPTQLKRGRRYQEAGTRERARGLVRSVERKRRTHKERKKSLELHTHRVASHHDCE